MLVKADSSSTPEQRSAQVVALDIPVLTQAINTRSVLAPIPTDVPTTRVAACSPSRQGYPCPHSEPSDPRGAQTTVRSKQVSLPRAVRKALDERCLDCCEVCGKPNPTDPHHRKRQSQGGLDTLANLLLICRSCHDDIHHEPKRARRYGYLLHRNAKPEHVPVRRWARCHGARVLTLLRDDGTIDEEVPAWGELTLWAE